MGFGQGQDIPSGSFSLLVECRLCAGCGARPGYHSGRRPGHPESLHRDMLSARPGGCHRRGH